MLRRPLPKWFGRQNTCVARCWAIDERGIVAYLQMSCIMHHNCNWQEAFAVKWCHLVESW